MDAYVKDLNELKEQILKDGDTLVSKKDLLERFCEMDKEYNSEPWNLLQILANINVLIGEEPKQEWIPVSKRLPKNETRVLTTIKIPNRIARVRSGWYDRGFFPNDNGGFFHNDNGDVWKATDMEVLAWMPLPEPYKESEEDMQEIVDKKVEEMTVRKKGKWINKSHTSDCGIKFVASECTCCGKKTFFDCDQLVYNYCPNCGAEMGSEV